MRRKISWTDGRTDRGKTVYPPPPLGSGGIKTKAHYLASCGLLLGNHRATIPQINPNFYSVPNAIAVKIQKDQSTRKNVISQKPWCLQTDGRQQI